MKKLNGESGGLSPEDYGVIDTLVKIPHKILKHHEISGLAHIVLHEMGHDNAFGLKRAAYFVDNPDFDHLVGVAGFCKDECTQHKKNPWIEPSLFKQEMADAAFNNSIRQVALQSMHKKYLENQNYQEINQLSKDIGITNPSFFTWAMHHGNHGLLIFEPSKEISVWRHSLLSNIVGLLSMCGRH